MTTDTIGALIRLNEIRMCFNQFAFSQTYKNHTHQIGERKMFEYFFKRDSDKIVNFSANGVDIIETQ